MTSAVVITYHAVEDGPSPLCFHPESLREHLDLLIDSGATTLTVSQLAAACRNDALPPRAVALTFDDGFRSVFDVAAPMLAERGLKATVFCVAGRLGGHNDWQTGFSAPRRPLLSSAEAAELATAGVEIGSHGMEHRALGSLGARSLEREIVESRALLEDSTGASVESFAFPYGAAPSAAARALVQRTYTAACGTAFRKVSSGDDVFALPRVDAHYLRRPGVFSSLLDGSLPTYLRARRAGARARRALVSSRRVAPSR